jgi:hypothetical protein
LSDTCARISSPLTISAALAELAKPVKVAATRIAFNDFIFIVWKLPKFDSFFPQESGCFRGELSEKKSKSKENRQSTWRFTDFCAIWGIHDQL